MSLACGLAIPFCSLRKIFRGTVGIFVHITKTVLPVRMTLFSGFSVPGKCLLMVRDDALAMFKHRSKALLSIRVTQPGSVQR